MTKHGEGPITAPGARRALGLLTLVYALNFLDRQMLSILAGPIKHELHLTDGQLGMLGGLAFALFYATMAVPIAWVADRRDRVWIVTLALAMWSLFTMACGLARSFPALAAARLGVGFGEAGGVAPSVALVSDLFPPRERARATAVFYMGVPIGSAAGVFFGGLLAARIDWRAAFLIVGLVGLLLAPVFRLLVREPPRGRFEAAPTPAPSMGAVAGRLAGCPSFWLMAFGASLATMMGTGLLFWTPSFLERSFGLSLESRALYYGAILLAGGLIGVWASGTIADRLARTDRGGYARVPAVAFLCAAPIFAAGFWVGSPVLAFILLLVGNALSVMWLGPTLAAVGSLVAPAMRASAVAMFLFINNLIGFGGGAWFLGAVSDALGGTRGVESLRYAILLGTPLYLAAAGLYWLASRRLGRDLASGGHEAG